MSIRRRLLLWLLCGVAAAVALGAVSTYRVAREEANALFDYQLEQTALSLRDHALASGIIVASDEPAGLELRVQIWSLQGTRLYLSHPGSAMPVQARLGYASVSSPEGQWRLFSIRLGDHVVQVGQPQAVRDRLAASVALRTVWPFLAILPVLGFLIWLTVGRGLAPLEQLARELRGRSAQSLKPLPERGLPEEITPLAHALNALLHQLSQALETQRAFIADAAHELRTPLTAIKLQAQLAERARDDAERCQALAELKLGVERTSRLVGQLLTLARTENPGEPEAHVAVRLDELAREVLAEQAALAEQKRIDLGLARAEPAALRAEPVALRTLISNLVDNALKYTPAGGRVDVLVYREDDRAVLEVKDSGPGIPEADRERVFGRFYRTPGSAAEGSGLGLAIVKHIAERHAGSVALERNAPGGLRVVVRLPAAP